MDKQAAEKIVGYFSTSLRAGKFFMRYASIVDKVIKLADKSDITKVEGPPKSPVHDPKVKKQIENFLQWIQAKHPEMEEVGQSLAVYFKAIKDVHDQYPQIVQPELWDALNDLNDKFNAARMSMDTYNTALKRLYGWAKEAFAVSNPRLQVLLDKIEEHSGDVSDEAIVNYRLLHTLTEEEDILLEQWLSDPQSIAKEFAANSHARLEKQAVIRKTKDKQEWCVYSHKGKSLGCYDTKEKAESRLFQVEMFKHMKGGSEETERLWA